MKRLAVRSTLVVLSLSAAFTVQAQLKDMDMKDMAKGMDSGKAGQEAVHKGTGVIRKIDASKGAVTLNHEPIKSASWPGMTMTFTVKDRKMLANLKNEQKVQFEFVQRGKENIITSIR